MFLDDKDSLLLLDLNENLKAKTLENWNKTNNTKYSVYSPWMCSTSIPVSWIKKILDYPNGKGNLITNRDYLNLLNRFLVSDGQFIVRQLSSYDDEFNLFIEIEAEGSNQSRLFGKAINLIMNDKYFCEIWTGFVASVLPLNMFQDLRLFSSSSHFSRGIIYMSFYGFKNDYISLSIELIHELGHQVLMALNSADSFFNHDPIEITAYSGIKGIQRPAIQTLQAAMALAYMVKFCRSIERLSWDLESRELIKQKKKSSIQKLSISIKSLEEKCSFTKVGKLIIEDFKKIGKMG